MEAVKLHRTTLEGDHPSIQRQEASHDLGHCHCRQTCVQEGEVSQEVVHRGREMRVRGHSYENEKIPSQGDAVDEEQKEEEEAGVFSCVHQTLQEEVAYHSLVGVFCRHDCHTPRAASSSLCNNSDISRHSK